MLVHPRYMLVRSVKLPQNDKGPETLSFRAFCLVAGAGFEPATFGL